MLGRNLGPINHVVILNAENNQVGLCTRERQMRFLVLALGIASLLAPLGRSQDAAGAPMKSEAKSDIFSGTVTELSSDSVSVVRKVAGTEPVLRKFVLDGRTKVEGKLRVNARVTVQFEAAEAADQPGHALHIIVR